MSTIIVARIGVGLVSAVALLAGAFELAWLGAEAPAAREAKAVAPAPPPEPAPVPAPDPDFVVRRILDIPGPLRMGDYVWDEAGAPDGPVVITVDLEAQVLSVFRGGYEIGAAAILYGHEEKPTPLGAFPISEKDAVHHSNLYDSPMPYMLRLTDDGITIHGSDHVEPGFATHGCIGVPVEFAARLFAAAKVGDLVLITNGKRLQMGEPIVGA
jgi:L,D-transpeptidase-like protein